MLRPGKTEWPEGWSDEKKEVYAKSLEGLIAQFAPPSGTEPESDPVVSDLARVGVAQVESLG